MRFINWLLDTLEITALLQDFGILSRWRPWPRLAIRATIHGAPLFKDVADLGVFRYGVPPATVALTNGPMKAWLAENQGETKRYARDMARQIGRWYQDK